MAREISFSVQSHPEIGASFAAFAREVESLGFHALLVPDHPGTTASPFVALAAVAESTTTLRLGTSVTNAGAWGPFELASAIATLDVVSDGRALFGVGAGHTPAEWTMVGRTYPSPAERVANMIDVVGAVRRLLAGETVTLRRQAFELEHAVLDWPQPPRSSVPMLLGGNGRRLLRFAAETADIVEVTGLGRTLPDGHFHAPAWSEPEIDDRVDIVRRARDSREVTLSALVQYVKVTDDRTAAAARFCDRVAAAIPDGAPPVIGEVLASPFFLIGTEQEIVDQLRERRDRWGFDHYTVRGDAVHAVASIMEMLRS